MTLARARRLLSSRRFWTLALTQTGGVWLIFWHGKVVEGLLVMGLGGGLGVLPAQKQSEEDMQRGRK